jgi:hypothetical protein
MPTHLTAESSSQHEREVEDGDVQRLQAAVKKLKRRVKGIQRQLKNLEKVVNCSIAHF